MPKLSDFTGNAQAIGATPLLTGVGFLGVFGTGLYQVFYSSGTFNPRVTAPHRVRVIGGGGGGGAGVGTGSAAGGTGAGGSFQATGGASAFTTGGGGISP